MQYTFHSRITLTSLLHSDTIDTYDSGLGWVNHLFGSGWVKLWEVNSRLPPGGHIEATPGIIPRKVNKPTTCTSGSPVFVLPQAQGPQNERESPPPCNSSIEFFCHWAHFRFVDFAIIMSKFKLNYLRFS